MRLCADHCEDKAANLGVEPETIVADRLFSYQKNLVEIAGKLHRGETVSDTVLQTNLDMMRLHLNVYEHLYGKRRRG